MTKERIIAGILLVVGLLAGYFAYPFLGVGSFQSLNIPYRLGLDLEGGSHLIYRADTSGLIASQRSESLEGLVGVIQRRVNLFGVSEPEIRLERRQGEDHLSVKLAGVFDVEEAIETIGQTPFLEFRVLPADISTTSLEALANDPLALIGTFEPTELNGRYLDGAVLQFAPVGSVGHTGGALDGAYVQLQFDDEGARLFEQLTTDHVGEPIAIFLDGLPISLPVVQEPISGGTAQITGNFDPEEARALVRDLNLGALPVPIELISQSRVEPDQGRESLEKSFFAGMIGFAFVVVFMILWYRLPGLLAVIALGVYGALTLTVFKLVPVTFTTAGIAGFILSIGMAVDANVLIFERLKEELRSGKSLSKSIDEGFQRAWSAVRDSNITSLLTALILWYFGSDQVRGFALTLGIGIAISMFSAIVVTRTFLRATHPRVSKGSKIQSFLYGSGFKNVDIG